VASGFDAIKRQKMKTPIVIAIWFLLAAGCSKGLRAAAEGGDAESQFQVGRLYSSGDGVSQDYVEAMRWYRKAADQGHVKAEFAVGCLYHLGKGVGRDDVESARWVRKAAEAGLPAAQYVLGTDYDEGLGVPMDKAEAFAWLERCLYRTTDRELEEQIEMRVAELGQSMTPEDRRRANELLQEQKKFGVSDKPL
jgi:TPR repeat protein